MSSSSLNMVMLQTAAKNLPPGLAMSSNGIAGKQATPAFIGMAAKASRSGGPPPGLREEEAESFLGSKLGKAMVKNVGKQVWKQPMRSARPVIAVALATYAVDRLAGGLENLATLGG